MKETLTTMFSTHFGHRPEAVVELGADASTRQYFRLLTSNGESVIGGIGPDRNENRAFFSFSRAFRALGLPVPEVFSADLETGIWLMEDLGDTTLFRALMSCRETCDDGVFPPEAEGLYRKTLSHLPRFQVLGHQTIDYSVAHPRHAFDEKSMRWDLNYFKYHFLRLTHTEFNEQALEGDFDTLVSLLLECPRDSFLYRDFQSRNVMIRDDEPWFIDFQGGRRGALQYDVASLLYDAKADIPQPVRDRLLDHYLEALQDHRTVEEDTFRDRFTGFVLIRIMQALGAYGYCGIFERKPHFLDSVPYAARNLRTLLERGLPVPLPELETVFERIADRWCISPWGSGLRES